MRVEAYRPTDAEAVSQLVHEAIHAIDDGIYSAEQRAAWSPAPIGADGIEARVDPASAWVGRDDEGLAGVWTCSPEGYVDLVYVAARARGQGLSAALWAEAREWASTMRLARLEVHASKMLAPLLLRRGFALAREETVHRAGVALQRSALFARLRPLAAARRVFVVGNSGSGKSTLARGLEARGFAHIDLDGVAFSDAVGTRRPVSESLEMLQPDLGAGPTVIEGCYADLVSALAGPEDHLIWLDLSVDACVEHARARPYEPHKWASAEAQDAFLPKLEAFIRSYPDAEGPTGRRAHAVLFTSFPGWRERHTLPFSESIEAQPGSQAG